MAIPVKRASTAESVATISNVLVSAFILLSLYFGRELLIPLALSALLTFMLAPLVTRLQRWLGRIGAILFVVAMMFAATGAVGWVLTSQAVDLANKLPGYKENIQTKLRSIHVPNQGPFSKISKTIDELKKDLPGSARNASPPGSDITPGTGKRVTPVEIVNGKDQRLEFMQVVLAPVLGPLGTAALEDLRNRMIRLIGQGRMSSTARAMDDAGARVSKYLVMQIVVNVTYGIPVAVGLYFIGVPNAILWGALATVLRFIPYVGPWIAASFPILLSLASSPGWMAPLLTIGLFIVLELISNNVMEPWLYGSSTGVTPIALVVAALAWTWLWGPVGLVLATPLTVCLVVMGRHIPKLAFLSIVLSDEEALTPAEDCYQRLLRAGEHDEMDFVDHFLKTKPLVALFDSVLIPVITSAGTDHRQGLLEGDQLEHVQQGVIDIMDAVSPDTPIPDETGIRVACVPARAHRDRLAGEMLMRLLLQKGHAVRSAVAKMPLVDLIGWIREAETDVVCISVIAPTTLIHARYLCSKLRAAFPELRIIVGLWGNAGLTEEAVGPLRDSGADEIVTTLAEALERVADHPQQAQSIAEMPVSMP
jgi:predicted PurR-regulated permease PerM